MKSRRAIALAGVAALLSLTAIPKKSEGFWHGVAALDITRAQISSVIIPITTISVNGYSTAGDLGVNAVYCSVGATSSGPMAIQDAAGTWFNLVLRSSFVNVGWFGAKGDASTDDSTAIAAAVSYATLSGIGAVYFPASTAYRITTDALTPPVYPSGNNSTIAPALRYFGDGMFKSRIRLDTTGAVAAKWIYKSPTSSRTCFGTSFSDLSFEGTAPTSGAFTYTYASIPQYAYCFQFYGDSTAAFNSNVRFERVSAFAFQGVFDCEGSNLASEIDHHGCYYKYIAQYLYLINNNQSINHRLFGCEVSSYGDILRIGSGNGGGIAFYSGAMELLDAGTSTNTYLVNAQSNTITNGLVKFIGGRIELYGNFSNLYNLSTSFPVNMTDFYVLDHGTSPKANFCLVGIGGYVYFGTTTFKQDTAGTMSFTCNGAGGNFGQDGTILFNYCTVPTNFSALCSITNGGRISAKGCQVLNSGSTGPVYEAADFDFNSNLAAGQVGAWSNTVSGGESGTNATQPLLKTAYLKLPAQSWPNGTTAITLLLPKNAVIKGIHLRMAGGGFSGTVAAWTVKNNDGTVTHVTSNSAAANTTHTADLDNYFYAVGSTTNERTLVLNADTVLTGSCQGGFCIVEYY